MRPRTTCRAALVLFVVISHVVTPSAALAEFEVDFDAGLWIPFLPDYTAVSIAQGGVAIQRDLFRNDQTDLGTQLGLSGHYRPAGAERRIEFDLNFAGIDDIGSNATFADPTPGSVWFASLDGVGRLQTAAGENATFSLDSDVLYNSQYVGIANTRFVFGDAKRPIDLGIGFSHLEFEQEFALQAQFVNETGQYLEDLDTNYLGGELRGSLARRVHGHDLILDFGVGFFNMNSEYLGQSFIRNVGGAVLDYDVVRDEINEFAVTVDLALKVDTKLRGIGIRPGINLKYISDMPVINHPMTEVPNSDPAFLSTSSGYFLGVNVEIFMLCDKHCY